MPDLTRIEAGRVNWDFEENDLSVLIREVIEILSFKAGETSMPCGGGNNQTKRTGLGLIMN